MRNANEIKEIEDRLVLLENMQHSLKDTLRNNHSSADKCQEEIRELSKQLSDSVNSNLVDKNREIMRHCCKVCKKRFKEKEEFEHHMKSGHESRAIVCKICNANFDNNFKLEDHLMNDHQKSKQKECDFCGKKFLFRWRLQKHMYIHNGVRQRMCHFFNNGKICPFEERGCKFLPEESKECSSKKTCQRTMCQLRH